MTSFFSLLFFNQKEKQRNAYTNITEKFFFFFFYSNINKRIKNMFYCWKISGVLVLRLYQKCIMMLMKIILVFCRLKVYIYVMFTFTFFKTHTKTKKKIEHFNESIKKSFNIKNIINIYSL